jgi:CRISPR-associated protein Csm1
MTDNKRQEIYLAALLHDIGKFYQRADDSGFKKSKFINKENKNLEIILCPQYKGNYSHKHVLWTAQFFDDFKDIFIKLIKNTGIKTGDLMNMAAAHHTPKNIIEKIIQKADHYSAGADRSNNDMAWKDSAFEEDNNWDSFKRIQMLSIFEGIADSNNDKYRYKLPLKPICLDSDFFPTAELTDLPDYKNLWENFAKEFKLLPTDSYYSFSETLYYLLEKYTSRIPSSVIHLPDVSLFDHLKTTAAFAICLYDYINIQKISIDEYENKNDIKAFALVGGNLSGIQKFIYNILPQGAAKNLKGRSFYLQLLVDNILKLLINKLNLFEANIVYNSGGGFYLIAPNIDDLQAKINEFEKFISSKLFKYHNTELYLGLDYVPFGESELFSLKDKNSKNNISKIWSLLSDKLDIKKNQKFKTIIKEQKINFFDTIEIGGKQRLDAITGEELTENVVLLKNGKAPNKEDYDLLTPMINNYTYQQIELGKKLKSSDFWIQSFEKLDYFDKHSFEPLGLGIYNYFVSETELISKKENLKGSSDNIKVLAINKLEFLNSKYSGNNNIYGFTLYGGNDYPIDGFDKYSPKTFEELCGICFENNDKNKIKTSPSLVRLGVLRMDVDNLGSIFHNSFENNKCTFSRYSNLSRSIDYFFKGYLNTIWENNENYKKYTQIIYSGGDDLFIVGKWDILITMAEEINKLFKKWTCNTHTFSISGGLAVVNAKFPLLQAAKISDREEKNAKNHQFNTEEKFNIKKNAFSFLNYSFNWEYEYVYLENLKNKILELNNSIAKTFPSTINNLAEQAKFEYDSKNNQFKLKNYQTIWLTAYNFKRAMQRSNDEVLNSFFDEWIKNIYTGKIPELKYTKYHALQLLAIAARWAELESRSSLNY